MKRRVDHDPDVGHVMGFKSFRLHQGEGPPPSQKRRGIVMHVLQDMARCGNAQL